MWTTFCLGLLVGWVLQWLIDWAWWRRREHEPPAATAVAAAVPFGIAAYRDDDLEAIEGIGPKIAELLRGRGVTTFAQLAAMPTATLAQMLAEAGPRFRLARPGTWVEQAALAARGDWVGFDRLRRELVAGVRKDAAPGP